MVYDLLRPATLLLLANAGFTVGLAAYVTSFRRRSVTWGLLAVLFGAALWSLADGLRFAAPTVPEVLFWNKLTYVGAGMIAPGALLFVAGLTNLDRWLRPRRLVPLGGVSIAMLVVVFTNQWHGLWRPAETVTLGSELPVLDEELGIVHVGWVVYVLLFVVPLMYVYLLRELHASTRSATHRRQLGLVLLGITGPVVTAALYVLEVTPLDLTPFGFTGFGLALTLAISRYRMLDIVPIARDTVVEHVESGVVVLDDYDDIVDANPAAARILGDAEERLIGRSIDDIADEETRERFEAATDEPTTLPVEVDGEVRHYRATVSAVEDAAGYRLGRVVIFSDVTAAVEREERLLAQTEALERKNEQLDEFASVLSHDLRNPLRIASLRLEQVETDDEAELQSATEALGRIERMTDQLLALARAGSEIEAEERVALDDLAIRAWEGIDTDSASLEVNGDLGEVSGSPDLLLELLENLFRNATDHNDGEISVAVAPLGDGARGFAVTDDGVGIDPDARDRIFDHGYSTDVAGTGYGLAIVEDIVAAHGWTIDATESTAGGARFEIRTDEVAAGRDEPDSDGGQPTGADSGPALDEDGPADGDGGGSASDEGGPAAGDAGGSVRDVDEPAGDQADS